VLLLLELNHKVMEDINERFARWQGQLVRHAAYLNNLLLTMAVVTIGFIFSLMDKKDFNPIGCEKVFLTGGLIFCLISFVFGGIGLGSRLFDYRATLDTIREEKKKTATSEADYYRCISEIYGKMTWFMFYGQSLFLLLGLAAITISLFILYNDKLF
jgi:hypothetical protein